MTTSADGSYLGILAPMILLGAGLGAAVVPLTLTAISAVRPAEAGIASALVSAGQQIGGSIGLAILGTVAATTARHKAHELAAGGPKPSPAALSNMASAAGYASAFLTATGILAAAFVIAAIMIRPKTS
jgi:hypothetical protein